MSAADRVLYATAAGAEQTRLLVRALRTAHQQIGERIDTLDEVGDARRAADAAHAIEAVQAACMEIEETVLLPALAQLPGADLPSLVDDVQTLLNGEELDKPAILDVREIPHGRGHPRILGLFARLTPGESFVPVNNHDPKPLRREFEATHPGTFTWDYLESGPRQWRVRIGRAAPVA